jgi:hypothetical protein
MLAAQAIILCTKVTKDDLKFQNWLNQRIEFAMDRAKKSKTEALSKIMMGQNKQNVAN